MERRSSVEIQAVTVDDAVRLALEQLGRGRADVEVEVLAEPSADGEAEALVRVTVRGQASQPVAGARRPAPRSAISAGRPSVPETALETPTNATAIAVTTELLRAMGFAARVVARDPSPLQEQDEDGPPLVALNVTGPDLGMLIGRRGEHLSQLQYLASLLINRKLDEWVRVSLDVEDYKRRREDSLVGLAERVARQVERSGRAIQLEPMPAYERRVIHVALSHEPGIATVSSGEGEQRRVVIQPKTAGAGNGA